MKEKIKELLIALNLQDDENAVKIVEQWFFRNSVYVSDPFKLNQNLFGQEKTISFVKQVKTSALKMGELALLECGRHEVKKDDKVGEFHLVEFLVFNVQRPEDREFFMSGGGPSKPKLILS